MKTQTNKQLRPIYEIADEIRKVWVKPYFGAVPYISALQMLSSKEDKYGVESADSIILYFLSNATQFRGEQAKLLKKQLKEHLK